MIDSSTVIEYLRRQRWFGAKSATPAEARIVDTIPLPWNEGAFAVLVVDVETGAGTHRYQLPVVANALAGGGGGGTILAAESDPRFLRSLADAMGTGGRFEGTGAGRMAWVIEPLSQQPLRLPPDAKLRVSEAEQSNTSIIFGESAILKLLRRLQSGVHPDVELTRFLTAEQRFPHTPVLLGLIRIEGADGGGEETIAAAMQEYVPNVGDGWTVALERARAVFGKDGKAPGGRAFLSEAARLGTVTRDMHQALARGTSPEMLPEAAAEVDVERWAQRTKQWAHDALAMLERPAVIAGLDAQRKAEARALSSRRQQYLSWIDEIVDTVGGDAGLRIRTHGDYHLGQVLVTASDDFMVIDFEGEPVRTLAERREKGSALRDVAGMLRSFAYAAAVLRESAAAASRDVGDPRMEMARLEVVAGRWEREVREAFLGTYLTEPEAAAPILPKSGENLRRLLALFEAEKAFYELVYELNNRPSWAWIPMRGVSKLLVG